MGRSWNSHFDVFRLFKLSKGERVEVEVFCAVLEESKQCHNAKQKWPNQNFLSSSSFYLRLFEYKHRFTRSKFGPCNYHYHHYHFLCPVEFIGVKRLPNFFQLLIQTYGNDISGQLFAQLHDPINCPCNCHYHHYHFLCPVEFIGVKRLPNFFRLSI